MFRLIKPLNFILRLIYLLGLHFIHAGLPGDTFMTLLYIYKINRDIEAKKLRFHPQHFKAST